jgi:hypothetical protein
MTLPGNGAHEATRDSRSPPFVAVCGSRVKASDSGLDGRFSSMAPRLIHRAAEGEMRSQGIERRKKRRLAGDSGLRRAASFLQRMGISAKKPYATLVFSFCL